MRISYLNGEFLPHDKCFIHIEDRGFQIADGVYEVTLFKNGKLIDGDGHIDRLFRSLEKLNISALNLSKEQLKKIQLDLFEKNKMTEGTCYMQITRGQHSRVLNCPKDLTPTIVMTVAPRKVFSAEEFEKGISMMTHEDMRWLYCDIKTVGLLAPSMINQKAKDSGFDDAILIRDGIVTEATFSNIFIVDENDILVTKAPDNLILQGITRNRILELAQNNGIKTSQRDFNISELMKAKEVFTSSSSMLIRPVTKINNEKIADGKVGKITRKISKLYDDFMTA